MTDDDPLDLTQVAADDAALDAVRVRSVHPDDTALELLRDLLADVERDLPSAQPLGRGSTVLRLASESTPEPGLARSGAVVALLTAGLVAFGGVAAASTVVAPGNPLHGLGQTVRSAAGAVVTAVSPPSSARDENPAAPLPAPAATRATEVVTTGPHGAADPRSQAAQDARSQAAVRQVTALLDEAERLLAAGRSTAAGQRLDTAERRLSDVADPQVAPLRARLDELRARQEAAPDAKAPAGASDKDGRTEPPAKAEPAAPGPAAKAEPAAKAGQAPKPDQAGSGEPARKAEPAADPEPAADRRAESKGEGKAEPSAEDQADAATPSRTKAADGLAPGQPSRLASTKPRA